MKIARTIADCRHALAALPRPLGLVPTMGALHDGHLALVRSARERCASVAASLFVNPTQFGQGEDFEKYPRDEARDFALLEQAGVDVLFAPAVAEMYPAGAMTTVHIGGPLAEAFEGAQRPGHFDGVTTIVSALFAIVAPDVAYFGQKDAQQLAVIRRFTADLHLPVEIVAVETVREPDGLARSSRNVYLTPEQRATAPTLCRALLTGRDVAVGRAGAVGPADEAGRRTATPAEIVAAATAALAATSFAVDYVAVVDGDSFVPESSIGTRSLLIAAARLGATRLLDNMFLAPSLAASLAPTTPGDPSVTSATKPVSAYPAGDATNGKAGPPWQQ